MGEKVLMPMPGKIVEVKVKEGDTVEEDQELLIFEAMKMENPLFSPAAGTISELNVADGQSVEADFVVALIE